MSEIGSPDVSAVPKPAAPVAPEQTSPAGEAVMPSVPELSPEQQKQEERVNLQRSRAVTIIKRGQELGVFTSVQTRSSARDSVESNGEDTKAVLAALRTSGEFAGDDPASLVNIESAYNDLSEVFEITAEGKTYKLSDLEIERVDPKTTPERKAEIDKIIAEGLKPELKPQDLVDLALDSNVSALDRQIKDRKARGENTKTHEDILRTLRVADGFKGKARAFVVDVALKRLSASGLSEDPAGLDEVINGSADLVSQSEAEILKQAIFVGYTPEEAAGIAIKIRKGDFAYLQKIGYFAKPGVDELFFGKELTDAEMAKLLGLLGEKRKFGKDEALMVLLMALVGVTQATRQAVMGELPRQR